MKLRLGCIAALLLLAGGCAAEPVPSIVHAHGDLLAVTAPPNGVACDARLRAETEAAQRIRKDLMSLPAEGAEIELAAADPASTTELLGIPLTVIERNMLRASGLALDGATAISYWVNVGAPERFGGIWIDPPGTDHYVVAVVHGDPDTIRLARCLERIDTRYVWADLSLVEGRALAERVFTDTDAMRATGIEVNGVGYQENEGVVVIGVTRILPGLEEQLLERYGGPIRVEIQPPAVPLGRHGAGRT